MSGQAVPERLELVRGFVNTLDAVDWAREVRLLDSSVRVTAAAAARATELREALRALCLENNGGPVDHDAARVLDGVARRAGVRLRFVAGAQPELESTVDGIDGVLGRIASLVAVAMADGTWPRLKACRAEDCLWAFYDRTRNRSRSWCSMAVCGNRAKARAYRARHGSSFL